MSKTFFISDPHLQHSKLLTFGSRKFATIEEHDQTFEDNWNKTVAEDDTTWILGDVSVGGDLTEETVARLKRLKGRKNLVLGNHDTPAKVKRYMEIFDKIVGAFEFKGDLVLTHIPVHIQQIETRFKVNIHGHLHDDIITRKIFTGTAWVGDPDDPNFGHTPVYQEEPDPRYVNVSCEQIGMTPVSYDVIKDNLKKSGIL